MQCSGLIKAPATAASAGCLIAGLAASADAQERVRWKLTSCHSSTVDVLGQNILRALDNIKVMSAGNFEIELARAHVEGREAGCLRG
jgi:TRAP-type mannitol/chloroaromatic compound transport system substrate-binding protein